MLSRVALTTSSATPSASRLVLVSLAALASSVTGQCAATQTRLSLTADATQMGVSWATPNTTTPAGYAGVVHYGTSRDHLDRTSLVADTRTYALCNRSSPSLHYAVMTGLQAGVEYWYSITEPRCGATPPANFSAVQPIGSKAYPFTIAVYGDMGISNSQATATFLTARTAAREIDLVLHAGDISCALRVAAVCGSRCERPPTRPTYRYRPASS